MQGSSLRLVCWLIWWCGVCARGRVSAGAGLPGLIGLGGGGYAALAEDGWLRLAVVMVMVFAMVISAPVPGEESG